MCVFYFYILCTLCTIFNNNDNNNNNTRLPTNNPRQAQTAIHQLRLNRSTSTAFYWAFIGLIMSLTCLHCVAEGRREDTVEHLLPSSPKWEAEAECRRHFDESTDISSYSTMAFYKYFIIIIIMFLVSLGHLPPP